MSIKKQNGVTLFEFLLYTSLVSMALLSLGIGYSMVSTKFNVNSVVRNLNAINDSITFVSDKQLKGFVNARLVSSAKMFPSAINFDSDLGEGVDADGNTYRFTLIDATHTAIFPRLQHAYSAFVINLVVPDYSLCEHLLRPLKDTFKLVATDNGIVKDFDGSVDLTGKCSKTTSFFLINL